MMIDDDNDGQMVFRDIGGLKLPDICLTDEEKPEKTSPRKLVLTGDQTQARCMTGAHATTWPTAVDSTVNKKAWLICKLNNPPTDNRDLTISLKLYLDPLLCKLMVLY